ncbi:hypothetical protein BDN71DRAFT_1226203 [Pleurotus eryngii]|uniref:Uncharacterized protein n=1 Tax=Pleurotus eryngii TaxID=5323 RepID=A0A9P5ZT52_PLEER|nr:hypothetical protein BDN71DRAFT_1226203 [Pleurotus eryngii]
MRSLSAALPLPPTKARTSCPDGWSLLFPMLRREAKRIYIICNQRLISIIKTNYRLPDVHSVHSILPAVYSQFPSLREYLLPHSHWPSTFSFATNLLGRRATQVTRVPALLSPRTHRLPTQDHYSMIVLHSLPSYVFLFFHILTCGIRDDGNAWTLDPAQSQQTRRTLQTLQTPNDSQRLLVPHFLLLWW